MKKFITYIAKQPIKPGVYDAEANTRLQTDMALRYPVSTMLHGYTEKDDKIDVVVIHDKGNALYEENLKILEDEIKVIQEKNGFEYNIKTVEISDKQNAADHLNTFSALLDEINDEDELFVDITYGNKPTPIIELMSVNAAYQLKKNVIVECIVYGEVLFQKDPKEYYIYDITPLFSMLQVTNGLAQQGVKNPVEIIRKILEPEDYENE